MFTSKCRHAFSAGSLFRSLQVRALRKKQHNLARKGVSGPSIIRLCCIPENSFLRLHGRIFSRSLWYNFYYPEIWLVEVILSLINASVTQKSATFLNVIKNQYDYKKYLFKVWTSVWNKHLLLVVSGIALWFNPRQKQFETIVQVSGRIKELFH